MKPKSLSASALQTASLCLSRYHAENIVRGRAPSSAAALGGTAVHDALEAYVKAVYVRQEREPSLKLLLELYDISFMKTFGTADLSGDDYDDAQVMLKEWFKRTDFNEFEVVSLEVKTSFPVKTSIGSIPFNYIWDRFDKLEEGVYRVTDYKTNRWPYTPADLKELVQARTYSLAANIAYPDAKRIWVEFDMLRHDGPVGVSFSPEDNRATYRWLKSEAERIISTSDTNPPETLNEQCNFCVRKTQCNAFQKHVTAGGVLSYETPANAIAQRADLEHAKRMVTASLAELDKFILEHSKKTDEFVWESDLGTMEIGPGRGYRAIDEERAEMILGPELLDEYGSRKVTMKSVDEILKREDISEQQKKDLRSIIYTKPGSPKIKVTPPSKFEDFADL